MRGIIFTHARRDILSTHARHQFQSVLVALFNTWACNG
jgi:hypothetical protein